MTERKRRARLIPRMVSRMRRDPLTRLFWRVHPALYRWTGGRFEGRFLFGLPVLLLHTTGRKSGEPRRSAICYTRDGPNYAVIASNAGHPADPAWVLNLRTRPDAVIEVRKQRIPVTARQAEGEERERIWRQAVAAYPGYNRYAGRAGRPIPVMVLEPRR